MSTETPWKDVREALEGGDPERVDAVLAGLAPADVALAVSRLDADERDRLIGLIDPKRAADVLVELDERSAIELMESLPAATAAAAVDDLPSDRQADLLAGLDDADAERILAAMSASDARDARRLLVYESDTAGGVMGAEVVRFPAHRTIGDAARELRDNAEHYADFAVQYAYVVSERDELVGVLRLRDLLLAPAGRRVDEVMIRDPLAVQADMPLGDLEHFFNQHDYVGVPVVDATGRLIGVVQRSAARREAAKRANRALLSFSGIVGGEELRSMPLARRSSRRLSWLSINIVLNLVAASVIALYQDVLASVIALAVFLPIVSDMSGCSGNQAVAVSMRELTAGLIRPREILRVLGKEASVGVVNGVVLGLLISVAAFLWQGNAYLGLVVGAALAMNTVLAVCLGGAIPLALKGLGVDPALASGPMLTTVTDMAGFFFVLSFAQLALPHLV